jgi:chromosome segregation ATPase
MMRTDDRGRRTDDRRRKTDDGAILGLLSSVLCLLILSAGCRNRALEQSQQEAREAKAALNRLNYQLKTLEEKIATKEAELFAVQQSREELQKLVNQLQQERDQAATSVQQAQEAITRLTAQSNNRSNMTTALEKQVAELKSLVAEQQKRIEQLEKDAAAEPAGGTKASPPAEPNQPEPGTP